MNEFPNIPGAVPPPSRLLYSRQETADMLHMCPRWLTNAMKRKEIPVVRCGRSVRFHIRDIEAYIAARTVPAAPESSSDRAETTP